MHKKLTETINYISKLSISENRIEILTPFITYLQSKLDKKEAIHINFICTHNSRRSHLGQVWMQTLAKHFNIATITTYSGGTEATAMAKPIIATLIAQGFEINAISKEKNPINAVKFDAVSHPIICFSKKYDHNFNPASSFLAIMTCSSADKGCPFVAGSEKRIPVTYIDPKISDNTDLEATTYLERSNQIASEMYYVLSQLK